VPRLPPLHFASVVGFLLAVLFIALELRKQRAPSVTFAWLFAMALFPYIGVPLYLVFGGRKLSQRAASKRPLYGGSTKIIAPEGESAEPLDRLLDGMGVRSASGTNKVTLLPTGEAAYAALLALIEGARERIHVATFILGADETGRSVVEALTRRAREKVEVRLLLDGLFALRTDRRRLDELRRAGGKVAIFMPLLHIPFRGRSNLRNHRKIAVADGSRALMGGMNLAGEYMGPRPLPGRWRDVGLMLEGGAAAELELLFRDDWAFASHEELPQVPAVPHTGGGDSTVRIVASGPDVATDTLYDAILFALFSATHRIWIATPYFVPDEALLRALMLACKRGIDLTIIVPSPSNHLMADLAGGPPLRMLSEAGARVLPYNRGMLHAKVIVVDRSFVAVGSANFDMRSLFLNYEVMSLLYGERDTEMMATWFTELRALCDTRLPKVGPVRAAAEDVARLLGPLV
jgi:cardiolipin synthase